MIKSKSKTRITRKLLTQDDDIIEMDILDEVKTLGRSGYVSVPKQLIGKKVVIHYKRGENATKNSK